MLVLLGVLPVILGLCLLLMSSSKSRNSRIPSGSYGWPFVGETFALTRDDPAVFLHERCKRFGKVFSTHLLGSHTIVTTTAEAIKVFLGSSASKKCAASRLVSFRSIIGTEQITQVEGEMHAKIRKMFLRTMLPDVLKHHVQRIDKLAVEILDSWQTKGLVTSADECNQFTYNVVTGFVCEQLSGLDSATLAVMKDMRTMLDGLFQFPVNIPFTPYYHALKARERVKNHLEKLIIQRRNSSGKFNDLLSSLLDSVDKLSDKEIVENMLACISAGQHTSALALMWMMKYLHENPDFLEEVQAEQNAVLQSKASGTELLTWDDTRNMNATSRVILETLRLSNVLRKVHRDIQEDIDLDGQLFPKGWVLHLYMSSVHLNEEIYPRPLEFDPSRFKTPAKPGTFLPFGWGSRMCPGSELAKLELLIFIHRLVTKYRWEPVNPNAGLKHWPLRTVKDGYAVKITRIN